MVDGFRIVNPIGTDEVAAILNVTEARARQLDSALSPVMIRGRRVYSRDAVLRYAADRDQKKAGR